MKDSTVNAIETMARLDPETTPEAVRAIVRACRVQATRRPLILAREAMVILGVSRPTLRGLTRSGKLTEIKPTPRKTRFYLDEVEALAYGMEA